MLLAACSSSNDKASAASAGGTFGSSKKLKFVFVNHVTTNPFFVPTRYGAEDACALLGCEYQWTGSENSNVNEMVNAMSTAITGGADGIAVALVDNKAFNAPTDSAIKAGIPVVGYNADAASNSRLAYIGQDLFASGQEMGKRIVDLVGQGNVTLFIATPGSTNLQPRIDGALSVLKGNSAIKTSTVATGAAVPAELSAIDSYVTGHSDVKGLFAVDAGSTQSVAQVMQKHSLRGKGVKGGGYDITPDDAEAARRRPDRLHHRPTALPAGLPAGARAVPVRRVQDADRHGRRQHRTEVPRQGHREALQQHEVALRGHRRRLPASPRPDRP